MSESASQPRSRPLRVAVIDRCVPQYRTGLYNVLAASPEIELNIIAAAKPIERIGTVAFPGPSSPQPWHWIDAPGIAIPGSRGASAWQWGAVTAGFNRRYDAILMMANPNDPSLWLCAIGARLTGKRLVFWTHGLTKRDSRVRRWLRVQWLRLAHAFTIYGHWGKAGMLSEGLPNEACHVCYNSLDYAEQRRLREAITPARIAETRRELFGDGRAPIAISLSRLNAFKKFDLLIRAHATLIKRGDQVRLLIVGDGPDRARLEAMVDELGVRATVRFIGECYDEERLSILIAASDVAVTPGAIGLTVMHCLAYGVPSITHDDWYDHGPEFEAIIDGRTGGFFRKDDADDLAKVMHDWLNRSASQRQATARACIAQVERFYRPEVQTAVMLRALRGETADDLWVAYQPTGAWDRKGH